MAIWVDDCLFVGHNREIQRAIEQLKEHFKLKIEEQVDDYLSCEILIDKKQKKGWIGQPHLIKKIERTFAARVDPGKTYRMPGTPHQSVVRPKDGEPVLSPDEQKLYRSGVGMLLYLVKYSRPDISNAVRELTKCMQSANPAAMKELHQVVSYVLATKDLGLKLQPTELKDDKKWDLIVYSDADWAGDKETRKSISGFAVFLQGCLICWKSKQQKSVSLSSAESEYYALSEAAKEIKFIAQILMTMEVPVRIPIICRVDNVGTIFMAENVTATVRTKHIDLRMRYIAQFVEEGFLKIIFVKSEDNLSDGQTKNTSGDVHEQHAPHYVMKHNMFHSGADKVQE